MGRIPGRRSPTAPICPEPPSAGAEYPVYPRSFPAKTGILEAAVYSIRRSRARVFVRKGFPRKRAGARTRTLAPLRQSGGGIPASIRRIRSGPPDQNFGGRRGGRGFRTGPGAPAGPRSTAPVSPHARHRCRKCDPAGPPSRHFPSRKKGSRQSNREPALAVAPSDILGPSTSARVTIGISLLLTSVLPAPPPR